MDQNANLAEIVLTGEGDVVTTTKKCVRACCDECGEVAIYKQTYLLNGAHSNRASRAYGKDDCSWCSDKEIYLCGTCATPRYDGYDTCSRFTVGERFKHMFLQWQVIASAPSEEAKKSLRDLAIEYDPDNNFCFKRGSKWIPLDAALAGEEARHPIQDEERCPKCRRDFATCRCYDTALAREERG